MGVLMYNTVDGKAVSRDLTCLTRNVYYEARGEPAKGKLAVAKVTLNRVSSSRFPSNICDVVYEQRWDKRRRRYVGAFAWTEFDSVPSPKSKEWKKAWKAAETVYLNPESIQLKGALFYHATRIKPRWAKQKKRIKKIGRHIFYR
jgi:spore germination cell wall hydrolase CwlJ-like protein